MGLKLSQFVDYIVSKNKIWFFVLINKWELLWKLRHFVISYSEIQGEIYFWISNIFFPFLFFFNFFSFNSFKKHHVVKNNLLYRRIISGINSWGNLWKPIPVALSLFLFLLSNQPCVSILFGAYVMSHNIDWIKLSRRVPAGRTFVITSAMLSSVLT